MPRLDLFQRFPFGWSININIVGPQQEPKLRRLTQKEADQLGLSLTCPECAVVFCVNEDGVYCFNCGLYPALIVNRDELTSWERDAIKKKDWGRSGPRGHDRDLPGKETP
jgi:hypothetical protein